MTLAKLAAISTSLSAIFFSAYALAATADFMAIEYVPGMSCQEVGGFAQSVATEKEQGSSLDEQIQEMRQSIPGYQNTQDALALIVRAIYTNSQLSKASPSDIRRDYEQACELASK